MNQLQVIEGVKARLNNEGVAELNLEDVARGLGFTQKKNGNEYVRWERVNGYLKEFNFPTSGEKDFIPENIFFKLCFKAENEIARAFQDLVTDVILPTIRKTGKYETPKARKVNLSSVNNAVKIITPFLQQAGISEDIQLLTVKGLYAKADVFLPLDIEADKPYYDTRQIAYKLGMRTKAGKPAFHAVGAIIKELDVLKDEIKEVWETNGSWQGVVKKYSDSVITKIEGWLMENNYPDSIESKGKNYYILYEVVV